MNDIQSQILANIIRDAGIALSVMEKTSKRHAAIANIKRLVVLLSDELP